MKPKINPKITKGKPYLNLKTNYFKSIYTETVDILNNGWIFYHIKEMLLNIFRFNITRVQKFKCLNKINTYKRA